MQHLAFLLCLSFPALLALAAVGDVVRYRIPNMISILLALAYLPAALLVGTGLDEIAWHLCAGLVVLLVGMALFFAGIFGGADAKLLAAAACWTGFALLPALLVFMALAGGVLVLVLLVLRRLLRQRRATADPEGWIGRQLARPRDVPYGLAIAIGGIAVFSRLPPVVGAMARASRIEIMLGMR